MKAAKKKPKLSIDGGGLAGLIPAECLIAMEAQRNQITGTQEPLGLRHDRGNEHRRHFGRGHQFECASNDRSAVLREA